MTTIYLDNTLNSPENHPPGLNCWVGGQSHGDPAGIKVDKTDTHLAYKVPEGTGDFLQTWYYDYSWYSGANLEGPFEDGKVYQIPSQSS